MSKTLTSTLVRTLVAVSILGSQGCSQIFGIIIKPTLEVASGQNPSEAPVPAQDRSILDQVRLERLALGEETTKYFSFRNSGQEGPLTISKIQLLPDTQAVRDQITLIHDCLDKPIPENRTGVCEFSVKFRPNKAASTTAYIQAAYKNGKGEEKIREFPINDAIGRSINVLKFVKDDDSSVIRDQVAFPSVIVNQPSRLLLKVWTNYDKFGPDAGIDKARVLSNVFGANSKFSIDPDASSLPAGVSLCGNEITSDCYLQIMFSPTTTGPVNDSLTFNFNNGSADVNIGVTLSGTGAPQPAVSTPRYLTLTPISNLNFTDTVAVSQGDQVDTGTVATTTYTKSFQVNLLGDSGSVSLSSLSLPAGFEWVTGASGTTCPLPSSTNPTFSLSSCTYVIRFRPTSYGPYSATLTLSYQKVPVSGSATPASLLIGTFTGKGINPALLTFETTNLISGKLAFGSKGLNTTDTKDAALINGTPGNGQSYFTPNDISVTASTGGTNDTWLTGSLASCATYTSNCKLNVSFLPLAVGNSTRTFTVTYNTGRSNSGGPIFNTVALEATGSGAQVITVPSTPPGGSSINLGTILQNSDQGNLITSASTFNVSGLASEPSDLGKGQFSFSGGTSVVLEPAFVGSTFAYKRSDSAAFPGAGGTCSSAESGQSSSPCDFYLWPKNSTLGAVTQNAISDTFRLKFCSDGTSSCTTKTSVDYTVIAKIAASPNLMLTTTISGNIPTTLPAPTPVEFGTYGVGSFYAIPIRAVNLSSDLRLRFMRAEFISSEQPSPFSYVATPNDCLSVRTTQTGSNAGVTGVLDKNATTLSYSSGTSSCQYSVKFTAPDFTTTSVTTKDFTATLRVHYSDGKNTDKTVDIALRASSSKANTLSLGTLTNLSNGNIYTFSNLALDSPPPPLPSSTAVNIPLILSGKSSSTLSFEYCVPTGTSTSCTVSSTWSSTMPATSTFSVDTSSCNPQGSLQAPTTCSPSVLYNPTAVPSTNYLSVRVNYTNPAVAGANVIFTLKGTTTQKLPILSLTGSTSLSGTYALLPSAGYTFPNVVLNKNPRDSINAYFLKVTNSGATNTGAATQVSLAGVSVNGPFVLDDNLITGGTPAYIKCSLVNVANPLTAGKSCYFAVKYDPSSVGQSTASLTISNQSAFGAGTGSLSASLLGTASNGVPTLAVTLNSSPATSLDFGKSISSADRTLVLTLTNSSLATSGLDLKNLSFSGLSSSSPFSIVASPTNPCVAGTSGTILSPQSSCQLSVKFSSSQLGAYTSTLSIGFGYADPLIAASPVSLAVSGSVVQPIKLFAAGKTTCMITDLGGGYCWGNNANGILGQGSNLASLPASAIPSNLTPINFGTGARVKQFAIGASHACALLDYVGTDGSVTSSGEVTCWGSNLYGQLGLNIAANMTLTAPKLSESKSQKVALGQQALQITAGSSHSCALLIDGKIQCWGSNDSGQLGSASITNPIGLNINPLSPTSPKVQITGSASHLFAGANHTCAVFQANGSGGVYCWGNNFFYQLGKSRDSYGKPNPGSNDGLMADLTSPVPLGLNVTQVLTSMGTPTTCALASTGDVKCFGKTFPGGSQTIPTSPAGAPLTNFAALLGACYKSGANTTSGNAETTACTSTGLAIGVGKNDAEIGALPSPPPIKDVAKLVMGGGGHICALKTDKSVACWGNGTDGQLGIGASFVGAVPSVVGGVTYVIDGSTTRAVSVPASSATEWITDIAAGDAHTCYVTNKNNVKCFGFTDQNATGTNGVTIPTNALCSGTNNRICSGSLAPTVFNGGVN